MPEAGLNKRNGLANFFGVVNYSDDSQDIKQQNVWQERRLRLLNRRCGQIKDLKLPETKEKLQKKTGRVIRSCDCDTMMVGATNLFQLANISYPSKPKPQTGGQQEQEHEQEQEQNQEQDQEQEQMRSARELSDEADAILNKENMIRLIHDFLDKRDAKRPYGLGLVGHLLERKFKKNLNQNEGNLIYSFDDYRPYFTYWVTTVQIVVLLTTIIIYGFGPFGTGSRLIRDNIFVTSLSYQWTTYFERENFWIGPRAADLVHLGAKFTPCMRRDKLIFDVIDHDREEERSTGCCMRNDESGCLQTHKEGCSYLNSRWLSWNDTNIGVPLYKNVKKRTSGPVCGQDPAYCLWPASVKPHEWEDNISKWPICRQKVETGPPSHHMTCELVGRPCCIGINGQCRITTSEHCTFLRGTLHPEATLCSQVSCMDDVCGMVPFYARDYPDQFYRLFTSLFLHAGLIHLAITVNLQYYIMRDIERLTGSTRMAIIYLVSGVAGNLASASFVPYHTQVGPSGSQFALLASLMVEVINGWDLIEKPWNALMKLVYIAVGLLILGLLPWIDNYAHIFGFITGFFLSLALIPYLTLNEYSRRKKVIQIWLCIIFVVALLILLILPLYVLPLYECSWCKYLDCIPIYPDWCADQDIKVDRIDIL